MAIRHSAIPAAAPVMTCVRTPTNPLGPRYTVLVIEYRNDGGQRERLVYDGEDREEASRVLAIEQQRYEDWQD